MEKKHAFLIMAHGHFSILEKLLTMLDDGRNDIFLHMDKKVKRFDPGRFKGLVKRARLFFTPRIRVYWGHSSQVDCELLLLGECLRQGDYEFVHLISGVDLPIKTQDEIHSFFDAHPDTQFLQVGDARIGLKRLQHYHFFMSWNWIPMRLRDLADTIINGALGLLHGTTHYNRLRKQKDLKLVKTANWFSLTGECAAFVYSQREAIRRLTRFTVCADEMFLGTVLYPTKFWKQVYNPKQSWDGHMRYIDRIRHVGASPHTFTYDDKERIDSSKMLLARKFDETVDNRIIEHVFMTYHKRTG